MDTPQPNTMVCKETGKAVINMGKEAEELSGELSGGLSETDKLERYLQTDSGQSRDRGRGDFHRPRLLKYSF